MICCSIVVTLKYVDADDGQIKISSYFAKNNGTVRLWSDAAAAQLYADRIRNKFKNTGIEGISILIIPGVM